MIEIKFDVVVEEKVPKGIYMTVTEFAEKYDINESTLRSSLSRGVIPSYLFYGKRLIPADFDGENLSQFLSQKLKKMKSENS